MKHQKVAIIGAGPIGLEAGLYATQLGYDIEIFERASVGTNILKWGHVKLFSPFKMNHSNLGLSRLKETFSTWAEPDSYLTGREFVELYLNPLSQLPEIKEKIRTQTKILSITREGILKGDLIGDPTRASHPFRLHAQKTIGEEKIYRADIVIDASGVYQNPNWLGNGGIPALGELASQAFIDYQIPDVCGKDRERFVGKRTLVVGAGYSAATVVCDLQALSKEEPATSIIWSIRDKRKTPISVIEDDPLASRAALTKQANQAVQSAHRNFQFRNNTTIEAVNYNNNSDSFSVILKSNNSTDTIEVDRIIAMVGYGPDNSIYRELQIHECYATRGPMKLAAALLGSSSADCLTQESAGAETLKNPEPDFYIIGNKSYGRNPTFLIRLGLTQIVEVFSLITGDEKLNLYESEHHEALV